MSGLFLGLGSACGWCDESSSSSESSSESQSSESIYVPSQVGCVGCKDENAWEQYLVFPPVGFFSGDGPSCDNVVALFTDGFLITHTTEFERFGDFSCWWRGKVTISSGNVFVDLNIKNNHQTQLIIQFPSPLVVWRYGLPSTAPPGRDCLSTMSLPFTSGQFNTSSGCGSAGGTATVERTA